MEESRRVPPANPKTITMRIKIWAYSLNIVLVTEKNSLVCPKKGVKNSVAKINDIGKGFIKRMFPKY
jgi:hypothetical protein